MEARRNNAAAPPPPGICRRLRRFLTDTFSPSAQREEDNRVPVIIHGGRLVEVQGEASPESGSKKATEKKSVTIKDEREEIQAEALKKKAPKESHPPPATKLSKAISDINQRAMEFIARKRQVLGRSPTGLSHPKGKEESSA